MPGRASCHLPTTHENTAQPSPKPVPNKHTPHDVRRTTVVNHFRNRGDAPSTVKSYPSSPPNPLTTPTQSGHDVVHVQIPWMLLPSARHRVIHQPARLHELSWKPVCLQHRREVLGGYKLPPVVGPHWHDACQVLRAHDREREGLLRLGALAGERKANCDGCCRRRSSQNIVCFSASVRISRISYPPYREEQACGHTLPRQARVRSKDKL